MTNLKPLVQSLMLLNPQSLILNAQTIYRIHDKFDATGSILKGDTYLEILKNQILPQLQQLPNLHDFYFQQDGAPPHYSKGVCEYLDETFSLTWIG